jgi:hypothetical protein
LINLVKFILKWYNLKREELIFFMRLSTVLIVALALGFGMGLMSKNASAFSRGGHSGGTSGGGVPAPGNNNNGGSGGGGGGGAPEPISMLLLAAGGGVACVKHLRRRKADRSDTTRNT